MKFEELSLEVIDLKSSVRPRMVVANGKATLNSRVIQNLESPENVQYCMDPAKSVFAIMPCKPEDNRAVPFSSRKKGNDGNIILSNKNLIAVLEAMIPDFDASKRYSIDGEFDAKHRVMFFDMSKAEQNDVKPRGRKKKDRPEGPGEQS